MNNGCRAPSESEATKGSHAMSDPDSSRLAKSLGGSVVSLARNWYEKPKRNHAGRDGRRSSRNGRK
jgi:hypothetical protein